MSPTPCMRRVANQSCPYCSRTRSADCSRMRPTNGDDATVERNHLDATAADVVDRAVAAERSDELDARRRGRGQHRHR